MYKRGNMKVRENVKKLILEQIDEIEAQYIVLEWTIKKAKSDLLLIQNDVLSKQKEADIARIKQDMDNLKALLDVYKKNVSELEVEQPEAVYVPSSEERK